MDLEQFFYHLGLNNKNHTLRTLHWVIYSSDQLRSSTIFTWNTFMSHLLLFTTMKRHV